MRARSARAALLVCLLACLAAGTARAAGGAPARWTLSAPGGVVRAQVTQARPGAPLVLRVLRGGRTLLRERLGIQTSAGQLASGLTALARRAGRVDERYRTPVGKRRLHRLHARTLALTFARGRVRLRLELLAADDGVAYRYGLPGRGRVRVTGERSDVAAPSGTRAWLQRFTSSYEGVYAPVRLAGAAPGRYAFPALLELGRGAWALVSESDVTGSYAAAHLTLAAAQPGVLHVTPAGTIHDRLPLATPWRIAVVGSLATIVGSDLLTSLGGRAQVADQRWIVPGRAAWSWWSDSASTSSLARQQQYVDFAARHGWRYVLLDEGWDPAWVPGLVAAARARGVRVLLWARWSDLRTAAQRAALLPRWAAWGVAGVKLDFPQSDGQQRMAWYEAVARDAAAQHLLLDFHGCTLPRGIQRRWPNVVSAEAVLGAEHYKDPADPALTPAHNATLPFTRNAVASMDYTPVTFSAAGRRTTAGQELALAVVFESGIQHFADSPESYTARPLALALLDRVPVAWDDTRLLAGFPGRAATIARRRGADWWVGSISAGPARMLTLPLRFLARGRRYLATIVGDGPGDALVQRQRVVGAGDALALALAADGGATVWIHALAGASA